MIVALAWLAATPDGHLLVKAIQVLILWLLIRRKGRIQISLIFVKSPLQDLGNLMPELLPLHLEGVHYIRGGLLLNGPVDVRRDHYVLIHLFLDALHV